VNGISTLLNIGNHSSQTLSCGIKWTAKQMARNSLIYYLLVFVTPRYNESHKMKWPLGKCGLFLQVQTNGVKELKAAKYTSLSIKISFQLWRARIKFQTCLVSEPELCATYVYVHHGLVWRRQWIIFIDADPIWQWCCGPELLEILLSWTQPPVNAS